MNYKIVPLLILIFVLLISCDEVATTFDVESIQNSQLNLDDLRTLNFNIEGLGRIGNEDIDDCLYNIQNSNIVDLRTKIGVFSFDYEYIKRNLGNDDVIYVDDYDFNGYGEFTEFLLDEIKTSEFEDNVYELDINSLQGFSEITTFKNEVKIEYNFLDGNELGKVQGNMTVELLNNQRNLSWTITYFDYIRTLNGVEINGVSDEEFSLDEGIWMETAYEVYAEGVDQIHLKWYNTLENDFAFGELYTLEKLVEDIWQPVEINAESRIGYYDVGLMLSPQSSMWKTYYVEMYSDSLSKGKYRLETTFYRETLDGVKYENGDHPMFTTYAYFVIEEEAVKRDMSNIYKNRFEYINEDYGFCIYFPEEWKDFSVVYEEPEEPEELQGLEEALNKQESSGHGVSLNDLYYAIDNQYSIMRLKHPKGSEITLYQDIVLLFFDADSWINNVRRVTGGNNDMLPKHVRISENYFLAIAPFHYDETLNNYEEVQTILYSFLQRY